MRNFDLHNVLLDENGNVFSGKIYFTERDGDVSNLKPIYASDGSTQLTNPIYSTSYGTTSSQVFLASGDYSVWVYRYTGSGDMTSDTSNWEKVPYSPFIVTDVTTDIALSISSLALPQVPNVAKLRTHGTDIPLTEDGQRLVALTGYNVAGDKGVSYYKYSAIGSDSDDGGSVIGINGDTAHCWRMVNSSEFVDVADFGVFPGDGSSSQLSSAVAYANANGKSLKLNKGNYNVDSSLNVLLDVIADGATITASSAFTLTCRNLYCGTNALIGSSSKKLTLVSDFAKSSWANGSSGVDFKPRFKMVFDKDYSQALNGVIVEIAGDVSVTSTSWTDCPVFKKEAVYSKEFKSSTNSSTYSMMDGDKIKSSNGDLAYTEINGENVTVNKGALSTVIDGGNITSSKLTVSGEGSFGVISTPLLDVELSRVHVKATTLVDGTVTFSNYATFNGNTKINNLDSESLLKFEKVKEIELDNSGRNTFLIGSGDNSLLKTNLFIAKPKVNVSDQYDGYPRINIVGNSFADGTRLTVQYIPIGTNTASSTVDVYQTGVSGEQSLFVCRIPAGQYIDLRYYNSGGARGWLPFARFV